MSTPAADQWRRDLTAWALPQELLDAVDESPYGWAPKMWRRRSRAAEAETVPPRTLEIVRSFDPATIVDIGAGRGRASMRLAVEGRRVIMVEPDASMRAGIAEEVNGLDVVVIGARWPEAKAQLGHVDVVMSANVVYDVPAITEFVAAMHEAAQRAVVIEMTVTHPWSSLTPYYEALHGLSRPDGPTSRVFADVVCETVGIEPTTDLWSRGGGVWFEDIDEVVDYYAKRLLVPSARRDEVRALLERDLVTTDGQLRVGPTMRQLATVWWPTQ